MQSTVSAASAREHRSHRLLPLALLVLLATQVGMQCPQNARIVIHTPVEGAAENCLAEVSFELIGDFEPGSVEASLNFQPLVAAETTANHFTAAVGPELLTENVLLVRARRTSDNKVLTVGRSFSVQTPRAYQISEESDLITGPLAHGRVGDYMISNCVARFVIQDVAQRDLYSVGGFGGNLIDLERVDRPGLDNFIEIQPTLDVETVINAQTLQIVNDGANGEPASIRTCGPDDLLDFINPSSQLTGIPGVTFPAHADDLDLNIEGCTVYSLALNDSALRMETTVTNSGGFGWNLVVGDWINAGGELEDLFTPSDGPGSLLTSDLGAISWFGYGEATGVDYQYTTIPLPEDTEGLVAGFLTTAGVTLALHNISVLQLILFGFDSPFRVEPGESKSFTRWVGVGHGSPSGAIDLANRLKGNPSAHVSGCVTVNGAPAPQARVAIGTLNGAEIDRIASLFVTDASGCYSGSIPLTFGTPSFGMAAALAGHLYEGGSPIPLVHPFAALDGQSLALPDVDLPLSGRLRVEVEDESGQPLPARVTVVGFDPSPEPITIGGVLAGLSLGDRGLFNDPGDRLPFGVAVAHYTDASGAIEVPIEPGAYQIYVSRGSEYSLFGTPATIVAGQTQTVAATLARVLLTPGFISSDFHVHGINSADSRVSHTNRVLQFAGEGVENVLMTDHHVHTDLRPRIAEMGMAGFVTATIGEEITTFDYGHFNGYPFTIDPNRASGGSTDWAKAAPPGMDFPQHGAFNATPAEIEMIATTSPQATPSTVLQVNHIGSHFQPLKIDTGAAVISDALTDAERSALRLDVGGNLFHPFPALELWNGNGRGSQRSFLLRRIGVWFNHLHHGYDTTFIASTDTHKFTSLNAAGARTWTASPTDAPGTIESDDVADAVSAGRAVGGQGVYVQTRLLAEDGGNGIADLTFDGSTHVSSANGIVELEIQIQAPIWAAYDTIEIYANAATFPDNPSEPYEYGAVPTRVLRLADGDFARATVVVEAAIPGASRYETLHAESFALLEDTWFVVVVKGTDGESPPMFPVFPNDLSSETNSTVADLIDGNLGENGVMALGATNALYADVPAAP